MIGLSYLRKQIKRKIRHASTHVSPSTCRANALLSSFLNASIDMPKASQTSQQGFFKLQPSLEHTPSILFGNTGLAFSNTHNEFQQPHKPQGNASKVERAWEQQMTCLQTPSNSCTRKCSKSMVHLETDIMQTSLAERSLPTPKTPSNFLVGDLWNLSGQSSVDLMAVGSNPLAVTLTSRWEPLFMYVCFKI